MVLRLILLSLSLVLSVVVKTPRDQYLVDGKALPDVPFDIGTSYSGLMPITGAPTETRKFFFWYFPSSRPGGSKDLTIWLNGGPGCSSLYGVAQENGPFLFPKGHTIAVENPYSWHKLTNMLYVEQPLGTGFDQGPVTASNEEQVRENFLGFLLQFMTVFPETQGMKLHFTGESYAGQYLPYIQKRVYDYVDKMKSTSVLNPTSLFVIDGLLENNAFFQTELTTYPFVLANRRFFNFNATTMNELKTQSAQCGYDAYLAQYLKWPAVHVGDFLPNPCDLWNLALNAATLINPCFDPYNIMVKCPAKVDVINPTDPKAVNYFSRPDVQTAIHAPHQTWHLCVGADKVFVPFDTSYGSDNGMLQSVIIRNKRTIWTAANKDFIVMTPGTQLLLNSMYWAGAQGFSKKPDTPFIVAAGQRGVWHEERGLTYVEIEDSGHQVPMWAPQSAYRMLEYLLGVVPSL